MPIGRRNNIRKKVIFAGIQGLIIGVVGVLLFGLILNLANDKKAESEEPDVKTPTTTEEKDKVEVTGEVEGKSLPFQAKQYGMFTSKESALAFIGSQPSLAKASIFQVENQFFVWSDLYVTTIPTQASEVLPTFIKSLYVTTNGCEDPKVIKVMELLQEENLNKKFFESLENKGDYPEDLMELVQAISAFSDVPSVLRSHLFAHYVATNSCLKLNF